MSADDVVKLRDKHSLGYVAISTLEVLINDVEATAQAELATLRADKARLDWLYQATAGDWEALNDKRLIIGENYFRAAIDTAMSKGPSRTNTRRERT